LPLKYCLNNRSKKAKSLRNYPHKTEENVWKVKLRNNLKTLALNKTGYVHVLDSETLDSAHTHVNNGVNPINIFVYEQNKDTYYRMLQNNTHSVNIINGEMSKCINTDQKASVVYFDAMCGKNAFKPLKSILNSVKWCKNAKLALTFATRKSGGTATIVATARELLNSQTIKPQLSEIFPYQLRRGRGTPMVFMVFEVNSQDKFTTLYRPHKIIKSCISGPCVVKDKLRDTSHVLLSKKYDLVKWYGYPCPKSFTWEKNGSIVNILENDCQKN
jgi:hypothetical protein